MKKDPRRLAFLKALISAAWADGELSDGEIKTLSYYLQRFSIEDDEYEALKPLLIAPIEAAKARALLEQQLEVLSSDEDQRTLLAAVEDLLVVDNQLDPAEAEFLINLRQLTSHLPTAHVFIARIKSLWGQRPTLPVDPDKAREEVHIFLQRRLLEAFRGRLARSRALSGQPPEESVSDKDLYRAVIWAGLLAGVAQADSDFCSAEEEQLKQILSRTGEVPPPDLQVIVNAFADGTLEGINITLLVHEFMQIASAEESSMLLDALFLVAAADGQLHDKEVDIIRQISRKMGFTEQTFQIAHDRCAQRMKDGWN